MVLHSDFVVHVLTIRPYSPEKKYDGTSGLLALMECTLDEYFKASSYLTETMLDPATAKSDSTTQAAMNVAMRTSDDYWTFIDKPENAYRLRRFGVAMQGARVMMPEIHIVQSGKQRRNNVRAL